MLFHQFITLWRRKENCPASAGAFSHPILLIWNTSRSRRIPSREILFHRRGILSRETSSRSHSHAKSYSATTESLLARPHSAADLFPGVEPHSGESQKCLLLLKNDPFCRILYSTDYDNKTFTAPCFCLHYYTCTLLNIIVNIFYI